MTFVKLEDAVKAVEAVEARYRHGNMKYGDMVRSECLQALRSLPTDDGLDKTEIETRMAIAIEKMLCAKLNKEWQPAGMSITTLIDELAALGPLPAPPTLKSPIDTTNQPE